MNNNDNLYNPFAWIMYPIAIYAMVLQILIMGNPPTVTRDQLGRLGK
jgi:hypothetical protein